MIFFRKIKKSLSLAEAFFIFICDYGNVESVFDNNA